MQKTEQNLLQSLPESFVYFLQSKGINLDFFKITPPRYFRIRPGLELSITQLAQDLKIQPQQISKITNDFYSIPSHYNINHSQLYEKGKLYGMDISSGWVVHAMDIKDGLHILELCCAPGNKLMYIKDLMKGGSVTGVDISKTRIQTTNSLIKKYKHQDIQIYCEDATTFNKQVVQNGKQTKYDRVLVDAQCTHEGSLKHLKKFINNSIKEPTKEKKLKKQQRKQFEKNNANTYITQRTSKNEWTKEDFQQRFLDKKKLSLLKELQYKLLQNGFRLTKVNGYLVYSTCSFDKQQNQDIISEFLEKNKNAKLVFPFSEESKIPFQKGYLQNTVRFNPIISKTGGMFIAKIQKYEI